jgi:multidrug efflux pump subunit AcrA (membrane-fusion protein)
VTYGTLALAVALVAAFAFYSIYHTASSASTSAARNVKVTRGTVQASVSTSGNLSTVATAYENFASGGTLTSLTTKVGEKVAAGQVLATVDSTSQDAALQQATTSLNVAKLNYADAVTSYNNDRRTLSRDTATLATAEAGGTEVQQEQSQEALDTAEQQLTSDQNALSSAETQENEDEATLSTATSTYNADEALGCPASSTSQGSSSGSSGSVTGTVASAPSVTTDAATSITATSAVLNATINTSDEDTTYYFEYGGTDAFGSSTADGSIPASVTSSQVSATVTGLSADTTYLFTIVAGNSGGFSEGIGVTFTTAQTSCAVDASTVTTDQAKVTSDGNQVTQDQSSITVQELALSVDQANMKPSSTTIQSDKSTLTQDRSVIAQGKVGLIQDQGTIAQDEVTVEEDDKSLQDTQLVALISGTVTAVDGTVGQTVSGGGSSTASSSSSSTSGSAASSSLVTIQSLGSFEVVSDVAEADAIKVQVHQTATVTLAALPDTEVSGVVTAVSPVSTVANNVVEYPVTIALVHAPKALKDGMTAQVAIVVQSASNVLLLPSAAITTTGNISTVKVLRKGVQRTVDVTLGIVGSSFTQITSGLSEGETVVEPTASVSASASTGSSIPSAGFSGGGFGGGAP